MSTTTIRLADDLKARVAKVAQRTGVTPHNFMLAAIAEKTEEAERRVQFDSEAEDRYARVVESGQTVSWQDMRAWLEARAAGSTAARPASRKLAK